MNIARLLLMSILLFVCLIGACGDDDDDDSASNGDDDITPDDDDDDDTTDDDDDDDTTPSTTIVYDDGSAESGMSADCIDCLVAQAFTPEFYPATLKSVRYFVDTDSQIANPIRLWVFYEDAAADDLPEPIWFSEPFVVEKADDWNTFDFSDVLALSDRPITKGKFRIGFAATIELGNGPWIGWDFQGIPDNDIWHYNPDTLEWMRLFDYDYLGALMVRPTLTQPIG